MLHNLQHANQDKATNWMKQAFITEASNLFLTFKTDYLETTIFTLTPLSPIGYIGYIGPIYIVCLKL